MPTLTIKNLPVDLHRRLKRRAADRGRSLNSEVIASLGAAVGPQRLDQEALLVQARALRERVRGRLRDRDLAHLKRAGRP